MGGSERTDAIDAAPPWPSAGAMFRTLVDRGGEEPVFRSGVNRTWADTSWRVLGDTARAVGLEMRARGLVPGDAIAILSATRAEWVMVDMGAIGAGLVSTGIYPTEPPTKVAYIVNDAQARIIFVDTAEQVAKVRAVRAQCPSLRLVVVTDASAVPPLESDFISLEAFIAAGRARVAAAPSAWAAAGAAIQPEDTAFLIYTSGTTGPPKGAMIPHRAVVHQASEVPALLRMESGWIRPAYLPLCHVAERMFTYAGMAAGMVCAFVDDPNRLIDALPEIRPHYFVGVPRIYEKLQASAQAWIAAQPADRRAALHAAQDRALAAGGPEQLSIADRQAVADIRRAVGLDRTQVLISGGARCTDDIGRWQMAIGAPARDLYGMTECGLVAVNFDDWAAPGVVGRPCSYGEVRLGDDGEILVRGPHVFKGYLNLSEKTTQALRDGWYHTGDVGRFDEQGRLVLVDRLKDLIISSGGKNIAPSAIEGALKQSPYIADAVAVGDGRHFVTALVIIDPVQVARALAQQGEQPASFAELAASPTTRALIERAVEVANRNFSRAESVRAFRILPRELTPADEVMTPTMKLKRQAVIELFADLVEDMYPRLEQAGVGA